MTFLTIACVADDGVGDKRRPALQTEKDGPSFCVVFIETPDRKLLPGGS